MKERGLVLGLVVVGTLLLEACTGEAPGPSELLERSGEAITQNGVNATLAITSDWGSGYCASVTLTNASSVDANRWSVGFDLQGAVLSQLWNGTYTLKGSAVTVGPAAWNAAIVGGGGTSSFGFCASGAGRATITSLTVEGGASTGTATGTKTATGTSTTTSTGSTTATGTSTTTSTGSKTTTGTSTTTSTGSKTTTGTSTSTATSTSTGSKTSTSTSTSTSTTLPPVTVYIAGDSTVSAYVLDPANPKSWAGWGQMLAPYFNAEVTVRDDAVGGRTARRFIQEGHLATILSTIKPGDYLLVQFGTNDSNTTATYVLNGVTYPYYAAANTDFKTYLQEYIDGAHGKGAIPVLVTPPPRNSAYCNGGNGLAAYDQAMIALGKADGVAVVDLGGAAFNYLKAICPKPTTAAQETIFKVLPDGTIDGTHFQENGARILAGFVANGVVADGLGLAAYRAD